MGKLMKTGVLIPCYNEAATIAGTVSGVSKYLPGVIVVDDGSTDETYKQAEVAGAEVLRHVSNKGKGAALRTGFEYINKNKNWDAVIIMDGDGQHDCAEIPKFIKESERSSLVLGNRMDNAGNMPRVRWLTNKFTSWVISKLAGCVVPDSQCGFRLIKTALLPEIEFNTSRYDTESEILLQVAAKGHMISSVPIKSIYQGESSSINPFRDTLRFFILVRKWLK